jgi:alcohol dehydrogenase, propanol-preferring
VIVQFAVAKGIKVVAIDAKDSGLELSRKAGAQVVLDARSGKDAVVKQVQEATGRFVKTSLVLSDTGTATELGASITKMGGIVVQVAQPKTVAVPFQEVIFRDIRIVGSLLASRSQLQDLVEFVVEHDIEVETKVFEGLDSLPDVLRVAEEGKVSGKLVVVLDKEAVERDNLVEGGIKPTKI